MKDSRSSRDGYTMTRKPYTIAIKGHALNESCKEGKITKTPSERREFKSRIRLPYPKRVIKGNKLGQCGPVTM